jgi:hypothetical protein
MAKFLVRSAKKLGEGRQDVDQSSSEFFRQAIGTGE